MSRAWCRLYAGTRNHRKIHILRQRMPDHWTYWYVLIELAGEIDDGGWIYISPGVPYTDKQLAKEMGIRREDTLKRLRSVLEELKLISISDQGILLNSFADRNFESDVSTPRVQKYREKRKAEKEQTEKVKRFSNVSETDQNRTDTEQIQNRTEKNIKKVSKPKKLETHLPEDFGISDAVRKWAEKDGHTRLNERLESFRDYALSNGKKYFDWDSAFKRAIRDDWAKISGNGQNRRSPLKPGESHGNQTPGETDKYETRKGRNIVDLDSPE